MDLIVALLPASAPRRPADTHADSPGPCPWLAHLRSTDRHARPCVALAVCRLRHTHRPAALEHAPRPYAMPLGCPGSRRDRGPAWSTMATASAANHAHLRTVARRCSSRSARAAPGGLKWSGDVIHLGRGGPLILGGPLRPTSGEYILLSG